MVGQNANALSTLSASKVVVTGAGGAIGSRLVRRMADLGAAVTAVDLHKPNPEQRLDGVFYVAADIMDVDTLRPLLDGADIVYHLAYLMGEEANRDPIAAARINTLGGTQILQSCLDARVGRVLLASSVSVFGSRRDYEPQNMLLDDHAALLGAKGIPVYAAGKIYLEKVAAHYRQRYGMLVGGLRPGAVIGCSRSTGRAKTVANIVAAAASGEMVCLQNGNAAFQAIHVDDVVSAFLALAITPPENLADTSFYNLAGDYATIRSYCDEVVRVLPNAQFDISDGESDELFGCSPLVLDDGIHRLIGFERNYRSLEQAIRAESDDVMRSQVCA